MQGFSSSSPGGLEGLQEWRHAAAAHGFQGGSGGGSGFGSPADLRPCTVFTNASVVWTAQGPDHRVAAFAVGADGRFLAAGSDEECLLAAAGGGGRVAVVDLRGAAVVPGLVDAHVHLIPGGLSLRRLDLSGVASKQAFVEAVSSSAAAVEPGAWLLGAGWDEGRWGGEPPSAAWVDAATPRTPVWLLRADAHSGLANSEALRLAGVGPGTPDPRGGSIARGAGGRPTGLLVDAAMQLVARAAPPASLEERRRAFQLGVRHALSRGITQLHDMGR